MKRVLCLVVVIFSLHACKSSPPQLSEEQKKDFTETWLLYFKEDPSWPKKRDVALQDPNSRSFIIENLIRELVVATDESHSTDVSHSRRSEKAKQELVAIGPQASPWLIALFAAKDPAVATICSQALAAMGERAVPVLKPALGDKEPKIRIGAIRSLAWMETPREQTAVIAALQKDTEWTVRGAAAKELEHYPNTTTVTALEAALKDSDSFVRRSAAESLKNLNQVRSVPALIDYLGFALEKSDTREVDAAIEALRFLSKKKYGPDLKAWQQWWLESRK